MSNTLLEAVLMVVDASLGIGRLPLCIMDIGPQVNPNGHYASDAFNKIEMATHVFYIKNVLKSKIMLINYDTLRFTPLSGTTGRSKNATD